MKNGDPAKEPLYTAMGECLSEFEGLEWHMCGLFNVALGFDDGAADAIWQCAPSFHARLKLVEAAFTSSSRDSIKLGSRAEFKKLLKKAQEMSELRGHIAHGVVTNCSVNNEDMGFLLLPSIGRKRGKDNRPAFSYTAADIENITRRIAIVHEEIVKFALPIYQHRMEQMKLLAQTSSEPITTPC